MKDVYEIIRDQLKKHMQDWAAISIARNTVESTTPNETWSAQIEYEIWNRLSYFMESHEASIISQEIKSQLDELLAVTA